MVLFLKIIFKELSYYLKFKIIVLVRNWRKLNEIFPKSPTPTLLFLCIDSHIHLSWAMSIVIHVYFRYFYNNNQYGGKQSNVLFQLFSYSIIYDNEPLSILVIMLELNPSLLHKKTMLA